jgi:hypothetical protein
MSELHACHLIWNLAGRQAPTDPAKGEGPCALCGQVGPLHATIGSNFTDYRKLSRTEGTRMCVACSWTLGGRPPRTLRMWSLVARIDRPAPPSQPGAYVAGEHLHLTNRRDLRWVAATLADPPAGGSPWLVAVAETGQKHTAPFAAVNYGTARWSTQLDGCDVTSTPRQWRTVLAHTAALRAAGFAAKDIESGGPPVVALTGGRLAIWCAHAPQLAAHQGTPLLHLANLVITKETVGDYLTTYPTD